jgi:hypothetical protein
VCYTPCRCPVDVFQGLPAVSRTLNIDQAAAAKGKQELSLLSSFTGHMSQPAQHDMCMSRQTETCDDDTFQ